MRTSAYLPSLKRTCYNCGLFGHQAKDCPKSGNPVCYNCGSKYESLAHSLNRELTVLDDGHLSKDCTEPEKEKSCYNCGGTGHLLRECKEEPRKAAVIVPGTSSTAVGESSTSSTESTDSNSATPATPAVPTGPSTSTVECYKCGKTGHIARNCNSRGPRKQCYSCGGFGHFSKDCRQGQKCYKCGEMGHVSKDCAHADQDKVCYVCKQPGHVASQCTSNESEHTDKEITGEDVTAPIVSSSPVIVSTESA